MGAALAGCIGGGDGGSEGLRVGHLGPMDNPLGIGSFRSAELAVEEINGEDGVDGEEIELIEADTQADPSEAQNVTEELVQQDDVDVLIGGFASEVSHALVDLAADFEVPYLITGSADPRLSTGYVGDSYDEYKNVFRIGPINSDLQAEAIAGYCEYLSNERGWDTVAFLRDQADWTEAFAELIPDMLSERGIDIAMEEALSIDIEDFSPVMSDVDDSGADYVLRFFAHIEASQMLGIWHDNEYEFGIEGIHVSGMLPEYYGATEGAALYETTAQTGGGGVTEITDRTQPFIEAYQDSVGEDDDPPLAAPMYMGFNTYDGLFILAEALESAGTTAPRNNLDDFVEAMLETDHDGASGHQEFYGPDDDYPHDLKEVRGDDGEISNYPMTQWQADGALECIYPEQYQTAEHVAPDWME